MSNTDNEKETVIRVRDLVNQFDDFRVHDHLDLDVYQGEILGVVGGSGTGKSVLMRAIVGLRPPDGGTVWMLGQQTEKLNEDERSAVNRKVGLLFQDGALFSSMTVAQNIMAPLLETLQISEQLALEIAYSKISLAGLASSAADKYPSELSGGMRKRAALARALALDPEILFLDEPTAGLDPIGASKFDELIINLRDALGLTVFMITHDLDSLTRDCDRVGVLAEKKLIAAGPLEEVRRNPHLWIQEYFSGPRGRAALSEQTGMVGTTLQGRG